MVRLVKFSLMGLCLQALLAHYFYVVLDHYFTTDTISLDTDYIHLMAFDELLYVPTITFLVILYL